MKKHFHKHHQNANFAHSAHRKDYLLIVKTGVGNRSISKLISHIFSLWQELTPSVNQPMVLS